MDGGASKTERKSKRSLLNTQDVTIKNVIYLALQIADLSAVAFVLSGARFVRNVDALGQQLVVCEKNQTNSMSKTMKIRNHLIMNHTCNLI
jgi:hypothetical protein